ncbi:MAG: hypothetical protein OEY79_03135 [Anaplasmataceae bacterium]|nr:hypothetical protein [Anaplasmataceae bacterium]
MLYYNTNANKIFSKKKLKIIISLYDAGDAGGAVSLLGKTFKDQYYLNEYQHPNIIEDI